MSDDITATVSAEVTFANHVEEKGKDAEKTIPLPDPIVDVRSEVERQRRVVAGLEDALFILATSIQQIKRQQRQADDKINAYSPILERLEIAHTRMEGEIALSKASLVSIETRLTVLVGYQPYLENLQKQGQDQAVRDARTHAFITLLLKRFNWIMGLGLTGLIAWAISNIGNFFATFAPAATAKNALFMLPILVVVLVVAAFLSLFLQGRSDEIQGTAEKSRSGGDTNAPI